MVSGKHHCDARKKLQVTKLLPEFGIRREMGAEIDEGLFCNSI